MRPARIEQPSNNGSNNTERDQEWTTINELEKSRINRSDTSLYLLYVWWFCLCCAVYIYCCVYLPLCASTTRARMSRSVSDCANPLIRLVVFFVSSILLQVDVFIHLFFFLSMCEVSVRPRGAYIKWWRVTCFACATRKLCVNNTSCTSTLNGGKLRVPELAGCRYSSSSISTMTKMGKSTYVCIGRSSDIGMNDHDKCTTNARSHSMVFNNQMNEWLTV